MSCNLVATLYQCAEHENAVSDGLYTGDNIRLNRLDDLHAEQLRLLVECHGLELHATGPTHQLGGTLEGSDHP